MGLLDNGYLSDVLFADIYYLSTACLLILLISSFTEHTFLILVKSSLPMISFMNCTFGVVSENSLHTQGHLAFFPMLSSRIFIILHITFRSLIFFFSFWSF